MDKKAAGLLGAVAGLATIGSAHAAVTGTPASPDVLQASSYAELLQPIPDAVAALRADDAANSDSTAPETEPVQYYYNYPIPYYCRNPYYPCYYRYHHHHHHHFYHHHHHHHHHHHGYWRR